MLMWDPSLWEHDNSQCGIRGQSHASSGLKTVHRTVFRAPFILHREAELDGGAGEDRRAPWPAFGASQVMSLSSQTSSDPRHLSAAL